ncbi:MAG: SDR family oxidoreductase [Hyphomicrobiaceae bacterium]|nr:SDR family oxidoreductase [Hyphomicrobiaceae bacterium]
MLDDIKGKRVLITGSSTGIGAALALEMGRLGAMIAVHGFHSRDAVDAIARQIREAGGEAHVVIGDVCDTEAAKQIVADAVAALGGLDVLVNNAGGILDRVTNEAFDNEMYDKVYDLNVRSIFNITSAALPHLKAAGGGSIINTGSIAGRTGGSLGSTVYASAKSAVHSMTRNMAREFVQHKIRVNTIAPGFIITPFHANTPQELQDAAVQQIPMHRFGSAEECVGAYVFLASDNMSGYITGQIIDVNGGQFMP